MAMFSPADLLMQQGMKSVVVPKRPDHSRDRQESSHADRKCSCKHRVEVEREQADAGNDTTQSRHDFVLSQIHLVAPNIYFW